MYANFLFELLLTALINPENVMHIGSLAKNKKKTKIFNKWQIIIREKRLLEAKIILKKHKKVESIIILLVKFFRIRRFWWKHVKYHLELKESQIKIF